MSVLDENELEMRKISILDKKSMLMLNLRTKENQLHRCVYSQAHITQHIIRHLHDEIQKIDKEYEDISALQKKYRHHVWKEKWGAKCFRCLTCACFCHTP